MQAHSVHHDAEKEGPRERLAAGSGVQLAARRSSTPVQAIVGLFVLTLCAGQANATTSDLWYYNSTLACEADVVAVMSTQVQQVLSSTSTVVIAGQTITSTQITSIQKLNETDVAELWTYFSHLLTADQDHPSTLHTQITAAKMCAMPAPLGALRNALTSAISKCNYFPWKNGTRFFTALYRMDTECTRNAAGSYCLTPNNFFGSAYHETRTTSNTAYPESGMAVTTQVVTEWSMPWSWGTSNLLKQACPDTCGNSTQCLSLALPDGADCCLHTIETAMKTHLSVGAEGKCDTFLNNGGLCQHEPSVTAEISIVGGGSATLRSGAGVTIPPVAYTAAACAEPCTFLVSPAPAADSATIVSALQKLNSSWAGMQIVGSPVDFGPEGMTFTEPVTVCLSIPASVTDFSLEKTKVFQVNATSGERIGSDAYGGVTHDEAKKLVCFPTVHFSRYVAVQYTAVGLEEVGASATPNRDLGIILGSIFGGLALMFMCLIVAYLMWRTADEKHTQELNESRFSRSSRRSRGSQSSRMSNGGVTGELGTLSPQAVVPFYNAGYAPSQFSQQPGFSPGSPQAMPYAGQSFY